MVFLNAEAAHGGRIRRVVVNNFRPVIDFGFTGETVSAEGGVATRCGTLTFEENGEGITVRKQMDPSEHVLGFGEKAFEIERKRLVLRMWNNDPGGYSRGRDPIYMSIPFYISVREGVSAFFINSVSRVVFDIGVSEYDNVLAKIPEHGLELFIFEADTVEEVVELFTSLTGLPFMPPLWSLGHQVSRFSYYPESTVMRIVRDYTRIVPVSAVYLDIDYMDEFKLFTWDKRKFSDPAAMTEGLHELGVRAVAIMDPGLKAEQGYRLFERGLGTYVETANRELYLGKVWPGLCAFPDFFREEAVRHWKEMVRTFVVDYSIDGLWLDMNEPSVFNQRKTIASDATHLIDGKRVKHDQVHNAYAYLEVKSTYEAMSEVMDEPYILTRSGFAGIQKYAAAWTGDSISSWDDLRLQISMVASMGLSGIPFAGCDLGGFIGRTYPELLARYYQMAAFFPVYRNHKAKDGSDQELFLLPDRFRKMAVQAVQTRYRFMPYIYSLAYEAHVRGHPIIRPLCYEFQDDGEAYSVNDEYMVGKALLYAPVLTEGASGREVYLPAARWFSIHDGKEIEGPAWVRAEAPMPIFVRHGSVIPLSDGGFIVYGDSQFTVFDGSERLITSEGGSFDAGRTVAAGFVEFLGIAAEECLVDGRSGRAESAEGKTVVRAENFRRMSLRKK